ncbi:hypothetical protein [Celeribacter sp. ULVN23_4]
MNEASLIFPLRVGDGAGLEKPIRFDRWEDLFNIGVWNKATTSENICFRIDGSGRALVQLWHKTGGAPAAPLFSGEVDLPWSFPLASNLSTGVIWPEITPLKPTQIPGLGWWADPPRTPARLAIVITTFQRDDAIKSSAEKITATLQAAFPPDAAHLFVIDNGRSVDLRPNPRMTSVANPNLGGAGGFARGLALAQDAGFTHCLFMDDDASTTPEALIRTYAFLSRARSPDTAVAGAMLTDTVPPHLFEYGAKFDGLCRPLCHGLDPNDPKAALAIEQDNTGALPAQHYGGWWFFAFPLAHLRHWPFPFFVRGDDSSFALANRFEIWRLSGVASRQEGFDVKSSPLTRYLDFRYHLVHGLVFDDLTLSRWRGLAVALRLILRNILTLHYDSAEAELMAWRDVLSGPTRFTSDPGAVQARQDIARLVGTECWTVSKLSHTPPPELLENPWHRRIVKLTLNGHLVPFWGKIAQKRRIPRDMRGDMRAYVFARHVTVEDHASGRVMVLRHDKGRAFRILLKSAALSTRWLLRHTGLQRDYKQGYATCTTRGYWEQQFRKGAA